MEFRYEQRFRVLQGLIGLAGKDRRIHLNLDEAIEDHDNFISTGTQSSCVFHYSNSRAQSVPLRLLSSDTSHRDQWL
ncbi:hypothetical protein [Marinomonas vulgaris]|uniref:hypothetical protein n=1 Tax=Marinomonas vulgaris TaxID=2823372 RepID=UPI001F220151|nr:hypothetical protein [Marinomonas vulgaris]